MEYTFDLIGGPLDGFERFTWRWADNEVGREGERTGLLCWEGVEYQANPERTKATFVRGKPSPALLRQHLYYD